MVASLHAHKQLWYWRGVASATLHAGNDYGCWEALLRSVWEE